MSASTEQRKLAAIRFTGTLGFTTLTQRKEIPALESCKEHRRVECVVRPRVKA